ncbi:MAG TPA: TonB-dependent receptor, partial [Burkholderiaceae bacterium]|nr:TonB-dependent receptor [Burkholderiaceae bacterium]
MPSTLTVIHPQRPHGIALAIAILLSTQAVRAQTEPATDNKADKPVQEAEKPAADKPAEKAAEEKAEEKAADKTPEKPAPKAKAPEQSLGSVVVTGIRASIQSAIDRKRNAATVQDSIVAEDVDKFPDKNVGEALSRITGVQLTREFGEGSKVAIRGVEPDLNRVEVNGVSVLGTDGQGGRSAELRELAAELIASIDVVKGVLPNITEGGVGGTVSITTRKPLDFKERVIAGSLAGERSSLRGGTQPRATLLLADKFLDNRLGLMANLVRDKVYTRNDYARNTSWFFRRDWDFSQERTRVSSDAEVAAVQAASGANPAANCSALPTAKQAACQQQWWDYAPNTPRLGIWSRDHERTSAELTAQYKFSDQLTAYTSLQANSQHQRLNDRNFGTSFGDNTNNGSAGTAAINRLATAAGGKAPVYNADGTVKTPGTCGAAAPTAANPLVTVSNHMVTGYTVGDCMNVEGQGGYGAFSTSARDFQLDIKSSYFNNGFAYKDGPWRIDGQASRARSTYKNLTNNISMSMNAPGLAVTLDDQHLPHFNFPAGFSPDDPNAYYRADVQFRPSITENSEDMAKLDFQRALEHDNFRRVWFGGQYSERGANQYGGGQRVVSNGSSLSSTADDVMTMAGNVNGTLFYDRLAPAVRTGTSNQFSSPVAYTNYISRAQMAALAAAALQPTQGGFFSGYGGVSYPNGWLSPSFNAAAPSFDTSLFNFNHLYQSPANDGNTYAQLPAFDVRERVTAGYVRMDFESELFGQPLDGNFGLRYTDTSLSSAGSRTFKTAVWNPAKNAFDVLGSASDLVSLKRHYFDVLPSVNLAMTSLGGDLITRAGWGKVMARPDLAKMAPNITCTIGQGSDTTHGGDGTDDCTAGNPGLEPYRATKYDLSFEYYPSRDSQLSLGLFRTDIKTYVLPSRQRVGSVDFLGDGTLYDVSMWVNGAGAITQGAELAGRTALTFLPEWLSGYGVDANITRMAFKYEPGNELINPLDGSVLPYPGMSRTAYNVALWYDRNQINARVAYHFRDRFYTGGNDVTGNPNFRDRTGYLDAKIQ